jgi:hypothetical protein
MALKDGSWKMFLKQSAILYSEKKKGEEKKRKESRGYCESVECLFENE